MNEAEADAELKALKRCVKRRQPFGSDHRIETATKQLNLESTLCPPGRPKKTQSTGQNSANRLPPNCVPISLNDIIDAELDLSPFPLGAGQRSKRSAERRSACADGFQLNKNTPMLFRLVQWKFIRITANMAVH